MYFKFNVPKSVASLNKLSLFGNKFLLYYLFIKLVKDE